MCEKIDCVCCRVAQRRLKKERKEAHFLIVMLTFCYFAYVFLAAIRYSVSLKELVLELGSTAVCYFIGMYIGNKIAELKSRP